MSKCCLKTVGCLENDQNFPSRPDNTEIGSEDKTDSSTELGNDWLGLAYITV